MLILQVHVILFLPEKRGLQPIGIHPSRGIAPSGFRPLRKIPHCCLPQESGPCLSSSVSDRPLKPDTDRRLGKPLPYQQANQPQASLQAEIHFTRKHMGYQQPFPVVVPLLKANSYVLLTRPPLELKTLVRLACVKHTASVHPEPGSNSLKISLSLKYISVNYCSC